VKAMRSGAVLLWVSALGLTAPARAWWPQGHSIVGEAAVRSLPPEIPRFFREGAGMIAHTAQDPDVAKNRATPNVRDEEEPEHYFDQELLKGRPLPRTRYQFVKLCSEAKLDPKDVGLVPYAVTEWTERLAIGFAEHRKWPENPYIRAKCLLYAGFLAHYAGDLCQPLHVTIHYDGRAGPDGKSPRSGIHAKVDSLIEKLALKPADLARDQKAEVLNPLLPGILKEIERSRALIDRVYALEARLPPERGDWSPAPDVAAFGAERARASTGFLASLYLTAWRKSATLTLPPWLEREGQTSARK
jgi:hypothetical protein